MTSKQTAPSRRRMLRMAAALPALCIPSVGRAGTRVARIISVGAAVTEIAFALGGGERIVAVDTSSTFPSAAGSLPRIGYLRALPTEGLMTLKPDKLLLSSEAGPPQAVAVLRSTGLAMAVIADHAGGNALAPKIAAVAAELGTDGATMIAAVEADWQTLDPIVTTLRTRPRAIFVLSVVGGGPMVSGRDTHAHAMLEAAGAINPITSFAGYRPLAAEAAAALAPDVIVMMEMSLAAAGGVDAVCAVPALAVTAAGARRNVIAIDGPYTLGFGPRAPQARRDLAMRLNPDQSWPTLPDRSWLHG